jgi:hypothetical protein
MSPRQYRWRNGLELPIAPEPVSSPPFTYGLDPDSFSDAEDVFKMDGVAQATPRELRRLFSGRPEGKEPTNQWFATQLHLYGVPFKKSARKADLKEALRSAVAAGKVREFSALTEQVCRHKSLTDNSVRTWPHRLPPCETV